MPNITMTRRDVKNNIIFYKFWAVVFALLIGISFLSEDSFFIYHSAGLFLALVYLYFNYKSLGVKGDVVSKTVMSYDSLKGSLMLAEASFIGWLVLSAILFDMILSSMPELFIDTLFFFVFVLVILYKRMSLLSKSMKK
jgi:hypothetical protein